MIISKKYLILVLSLINILFSYCLAQKETSSFLIDRNCLKTNLVKEIKIYQDSLEANNNGEFVLFRFDKGKLLLEAFNSELYSDIEEAILNGYHYNYSSTGKLLSMEGKGESGPGGDQTTIAFYKYFNDNLKSVFKGYTYRYRDSKNNLKSGTKLLQLSKSFYNTNNKIASIIDYDIDISISNERDLIKLMDDKEKRIGNLGKTKESSGTYFLYNENKLIGYFSSKEDFANKHNKADSIYYGNKMLELQKIGFDNFKKKYFTPEVYKKVIEDCYEPVKNNQLLINNKPIKTFLSKIGKADTKYIVFEIADNYFLFYKLLD